MLKGINYTFLINQKHKLHLIFFFFFKERPLAEIKNRK